MIGLQHGTVLLESHQTSWAETAAETIALLWRILGNTAKDIRHIGSTAISGMHSK